MRTRNLTHTEFLISHWSMNMEKPFESIHGTWHFRRQHCHRSNKWDRYCDCWRSWSGKILSYKPYYDVKAGHLVTLLPRCSKKDPVGQTCCKPQKGGLACCPFSNFGTLSQERHWGFNKIQDFQHHTMTTNWGTQLSEQSICFTVLLFNIWNAGGCLAFCNTHPRINEVNLCLSKNMWPIFDGYVTCFFCHSDS